MTDRAQEVARTPSNFTYDAVLLYNGDDQASVDAYYRELRRRGLKPWMASQDARAAPDWRYAVSEAMQQSRSVAVFIGPKGVAEWQKEEFPLLHTLKVKQTVRVVQVILPGSEPSDDMMFAAAPCIKCHRPEIEPGIVDHLEHAISGIDPRTRRGSYGFLAEVPITEPTCFVATSHATSPEIYEMIVEAARTIDLKVNQPLHHSSESQNVYTPDVVMGIRSAWLIVADGTIDPKTGKPDADVMYEVGLATALAKPVVFISTPPKSPLPLPVFHCDVNCWRVEYAPDEMNALGQLSERLVAELRSAMENVWPPGLIHDNDLKISVAYSELFHLCPVFWPRFEQIIRFGLMTKGWYAKILKYVHNLQQLVEIAHADSMNVRDEIDLQPVLDRFLAAYEKYCQPHQSDVQKPAEYDSARAEAAEAFEFLLDHTGPFLDEESAIRQIIQRSRHYFKILDSYQLAYADAHAAVLNRIDHPEPSILRQLIQLHTDTQQLVATAEFVPVHACEMMFEFLKLIGMRDQLGGK